MERALKPHDVLRIERGAAFGVEGPAWVANALARAPFVVVRRAASLNGAIAVGVRGTSRGERFGSWIDPGLVREVIAPESLARHVARNDRASLPAFALFAAVRATLDATTFGWGPGGSVGFELASGVDTVTPSSDLDVILRASNALPHAHASELLDALLQHASDADARIDVQVQTRDAAFSLAEFVRTGGRVMLRDAAGPRLVDNPWHAQTPL
jgi:phosphoribosyl-dephospho-CoA transferase